MSYLDVIEELCPSMLLPRKEDYINMYNVSLAMLNEIKLSRYKAMYFGTMQIGPDLYEWNGKKIQDFTQKYLSCSMYVLGDLYEKLKNNQQELVEVSLSIMYAMLALFINTKEELTDKVDKSLIEENNKYVKEDELKEEFDS